MPDGIDQLDRVDPALVPRGSGIEQRAEHRIAIEARKAAPDDACPTVDQERRSGRCRSSARSRLGLMGFLEGDRGAGPASHVRTDATSGRRWWARVGPGPTFTLTPPNRWMTAKPCSSPTSSPTNTGRRPAKGASRQEVADRRPLVAPVGPHFDQPLAGLQPRPPRREVRPAPRCIVRCTCEASCGAWR